MRIDLSAVCNVDALTMRTAHFYSRTMALLAVSGGLLTMSSEAIAGDAALIVAGDVDPASDAAVAKASEDALRHAGWNPTRPVSPAPVVDALRQCYQAGDDATCKRAAEGVPDMERILVVHVAAPEGGADATLTGWIISGEGKLLLVAQRFCEACRPASLASTAADLVAALMRDSAGSAGTSVLKVRSQPAGARVLVDGRPVGVTDLEYTVYPGRHEVTIDRPGYAIEVREVRADPGATLDVAVKLERDSTDGGGSLRRPVGIALAAAGIAAGAVGTWLMLADSPKEDGGDMQLTYRDSFWPGAGLAAAGAVAVGAGAWLIFTAPGKRDSDRRTAIAPVTNGEEAWVFACGHF